MEETDETMRGERKKKGGGQDGEQQRPVKDEPHVVRQGPGAHNVYFWLKFSPKYLAVDGGAERGRDLGEDARLREGEGEGGSCCEQSSRSERGVEKSTGKLRGRDEERRRSLGM